MRCRRCIRMIIWPRSTLFVAITKAFAWPGSFGDHGSRELLEALLKEEEAHVDLIESHLDQIKQMGVENYLAAQMD